MTASRNRDKHRRARGSSPGQRWFWPLLMLQICQLALLIPSCVSAQSVSVSETLPHTSERRPSSRADRQRPTPGGAAPSSATVKPVVDPTQNIIAEAEPNPPRIGEPVTLRGSNFGRAKGATVFIGGYDIGAILQVTEWAENAVTAMMPNDPRIRQDQAYYFRITRLTPREASNAFTFRFDKKLETQPIVPPTAAFVGAAGRPPAPSSVASTPPAAAVTSNANEAPVPPFNAHITDLTSTLAPDELASLESELRAYEQKKGSQIAVLMLPSTRPETIEQYSMMEDSAAADGAAEQEADSAAADRAAEVAALLAAVGVSAAAGPRAAGETADAIAARNPAYVDRCAVGAPRVSAGGNAHDRGQDRRAGTAPWR